MAFKGPIKCSAPLQRQKIVWLVATILCVAPLSWKIGPSLPILLSGCLHVFVHACKQNPKFVKWLCSFQFIELFEANTTLQVVQAMTATTEWNSIADGFV